jgi:acetyl-CoA C-acetyltransferase
MNHIRIRYARVTKKKYQKQRSVQMSIENVPVIIGVGEVCEQVPKDLSAARSVVDLAACAANSALRDTGRKEHLLRGIDAIAAVRTFSDSSPRYRNAIENVKNMPRAVARKIGIHPEYACYEISGGQSPQKLVNEFCRRLAETEFKAVLLTGGEAIASVRAAKRSQTALNWEDSTDGQIEDRGWGVAGILTLQELENDFLIPGAIYGVLENARRKRLNKTRDEYAMLMGELLAPFSTVAANHPAAMFPQALDAETIASASKTNPYIFQPYTRAMMAKDGVNQAAALVLTTVGQAREWGIDESQWIYLSGSCDLKERTILEREPLDASPAMRLAYRTALQRARVSIDDVDVFDLYSCFPIAVFNACESLGLSPDDPRGLTVTGGLPFFGGPGNNYSMHGIVSVVRRLRDIPDGIGVVGANGGFLSKHSIGVYSRKMPRHGWLFHADHQIQQDLDEAPSPNLEMAPEGEAVVESYSVACRNGLPKRAHVIARLCMTNARFLAVTDASDRETPCLIADQDFLGKTIYVTSEGLGNRFSLTADGLGAFKTA